MENMLSGTPLDTTPRLQQIQVRRPPQKKKPEKFYIRRVKLPDGRYAYHIPIDRLATAEIRCAKADRNATEQRLIAEYADKHVRFYVR